MTVRRSWNEGTMNVDLTTWLPAMFLLGMATLAALTAFVGACDKI